MTSSTPCSSATPTPASWAEVITERILAGPHPPLITAVSIARLVIASRAGTPTDLWQRLADPVETALPYLAEGRDLP